jgi:hypothetical protein
MKYIRFTVEPARVLLISFFILTADLTLYSQPGRLPISGTPVSRVEAEKQLVIGTQPVFKVAKAKGPITIDGKMDEADWKNSDVRPFNFFYRYDKTPEKQNSKFRMLWDDNALYLFYECEDTSLTAKETRLDAAPYFDDCAEFFITPFADSTYIQFCFEINITKFPSDFIVLWRYINDRSFYLGSYNPQYKLEVTYDGTINNEKDKDKGWKMELAIPFSAFRDLSNVNRPKAGVKWAFQSVRQDRNFVNDRFRTTSTLFPIYDIVTDVHQPAYFGLMEFGE